MSDNERNNSTAEHLCCMAYQMFEPAPEKVLSSDKPFPMYSYDRIVRNVLEGMIHNLLERGLDEEQIVEVLQSKQVRRVLDDEDGKLVEIGYELATRFVEEV